MKKIIISGIISVMVLAFFGLGVVSLMPGSTNKLFGVKTALADDYFGYGYIEDIVTTCTNTLRDNASVAMSWTDRIDYSDDIAEGETFDYYLIQIYRSSDRTLVKEINTTRKRLRTILFRGWDDDYYVVAYAVSNLGNYSYRSDHEMMYCR